VWTPKRVVLLASGFVLFCAAYVGYAEVLGGIDGLPALPECYWPGEPPTDPPTKRESRVEVKLQQAFGTGCEELKMPMKVESPKGIVIASRDCVFEAGGREVRLTPISMAFFGKQLPDREPDINTIKAATAILTLDQPIGGPLDVGKRRIVAAELHGAPPLPGQTTGREIEIRNNRRTLARGDDLVIHIALGPVHFEDDKHLIHTPDAVRLEDLQSQPEPMVITAKGLEVHLATHVQAGGNGGGAKPKTEGPGGTVEKIVLPANVDMHLYHEAGSGFPTAGASPPPAGQPHPGPAPRDHIHIVTDGPFEYDLPRNHARFDIPEKAGPLTPEEWVSVTRHPGNDRDEAKQDTLKCQHLELQFRRKAPDPTAKPAPAAEPDGQGPNLEIEWVHATGSKVTLTSGEQHVTGVGNDLFHQAMTHTTVFKGDPEVWLVKELDEIRARELEMVELKGKGKEKGTQQVTATGKGSIHLWDKKANKRVLHARWHEKFLSTRQGEQDLLVFKGNAALVEDEHLIPEDIFADGKLLGAKTVLKADDLRIWLDPPVPAPPRPAGAPPAPAVPPSAGRAGEVAAATSGGRRPRRVEATGNVAARSPEMIILERRDYPTQRLTIHFKDVADPAGPAPQGPAPVAVKPAETLPPPTPGPAPVVVPGAPAKPEPPPAKPSRPVELAASFITAQVLRYDGSGKTELDRLDTEGAVRVVQAPSADDGGFTIKGDKLSLKRKSTGNHLKVGSEPGNFAELRLERLVVVGPEIEIDQGDNTATVDGDGYMDMENTTDFQGNPLRKPEWLRVYWKKLMRFEGSFAEFVGDIQAQQAASRLMCQTLHVFFDKPVSLSDQKKADAKDRPNGQKSAQAKKLVCDRSVKVEEVAYEVHYKVSDQALASLRTARVPDTVLTRIAPLSGKDFANRDVFAAEVAKLLTKDEAERYQSLVVGHASYEPAPRRLTGFKSLDCLELMVENLDKRMSAEGPGVLRIVQPGGVGTPLGGAGARGAAKPAGKPADPEWTLTLITYGRFGENLGKDGVGSGSMDADNNKHTATFWENVRVLHIPWTSDPTRLREAVDVADALDKLPPGMLYMECQEWLKVFSPEDAPGAPPAASGGKHEMHGKGQVYVKATDSKGQAFWGTAEEVHYDEEKEQVIFYGGKEGQAVVYQAQRRGEDPKKTAANKIIYWRKDGRVDVDYATEVRGTR
jgi:hypothetical protein